MDWRAIEAMTDRVVLDANLESIRFVPRDSDGRPDPERDEEIISAVLFGSDPDEVVPLGGGFFASVVAQQWALAYNRLDYPHLTFKKYDRFRAVDRPGQPWFTFKNANAQSASIAVIRLLVG